jgi:hypothetical protein
VDGWSGAEPAPLCELPEDVVSESGKACQDGISGMDGTGGMDGADGILDGMDGTDGMDGWMGRMVSWMGWNVSLTGC